MREERQAARTFRCLYTAMVGTVFRRIILGATVYLRRRDENSEKSDMFPHCNCASFRVDTSILGIGVTENGNRQQKLSVAVTLAQPIFRGCYKTVYDFFVDDDFTKSNHNMQVPMKNLLDL